MLECVGVDDVPKPKRTLITTNYMVRALYLSACPFVRDLFANCYSKPYMREADRNIRLSTNLTSPALISSEGRFPSRDQAAYKPILDISFWTLSHIAETETAHHAPRLICLASLRRTR